jgi:2-phospho-L-lactate guanylyltransferase
LRHTLDVVCTTIDVVWVVSSDPLVCNLAIHHGAQPLHDPTTTMNAALDVARTHSMQTGADALLVIPADLPLLARDDVAHLARSLTAATCSTCIIAPNRDSSGTNALGLTLPTRLPFLFGSNSFTRYKETAHMLALQVQVYHSSTLALDIDTPEDLSLLEEMQGIERNWTYDTHWLCCGT